MTREVPQGAYMTTPERTVACSSAFYKFEILLLIILSIYGS